ncbi:MAG TPA: hypothetical protein VHV83_19440 [Armatimonadota bacterium]|nr:hypothetical protein [Armatimonadota bacterium]
MVVVRKIHGITVLRSVQRFLRIFAVLLCLLLACSYTFRFDAVAAITVLPVWVWGIPGSLLLVIGYANTPKRWRLLAVVLWGIFCWHVRTVRSPC